MYEEKIQDAGLRVLQERQALVKAMIDSQAQLTRMVNGVPKVVKALEEVLVAGDMTARTFKTVARSLLAVSRGQVALAKLASAQSALLAVYAAGPQVTIDASLLASPLDLGGGDELVSDGGQLVLEPEGGGAGVVTDEVIDPHGPSLTADPPVEVSTEKF